MKKGKKKYLYLINTKNNFLNLFNINLRVGL